jgi:hypothetical protein
VRQRASATPTEPIRLPNGLEYFGVPGVYGDPEEQVFYLDVRELARERGYQEDASSLRRLARECVAELDRRLRTHPLGDGTCWPIRILEDAP